MMMTGIGGMFALCYQGLRDDKLPRLCLQVQYYLPVLDINRLRRAFPRINRNLFLHDWFTPHSLETMSAFGYIENLA